MITQLDFNVKGKVTIPTGTKDLVWDYYNYPSYRFYVDNDLITERSWIWINNDRYLNEHVSLDLESGEHTVSFKSIQKINFDKKYDPVSSHYNNRYSLFFDVDELKINNQLVDVNKVYTNENKTNFDLKFILE